ncbi:MAG: prepilin-type N-terminal cleavage/methylation domain-containing protein [Bacteroidota bacterium]
MSKLPRKIPAYTLTEMLVVLAISTIVATLAFGILSLVNSNFSAIQANYSQSTEVLQLKQQLWVDLHRNHELVSFEAGSTWVARTPLDSVLYRFSEKEILRNGDTLYAGDYKKWSFNEGMEVGDGPVDAVKLEMGSPAFATVFVFKEKDAVQKIRDHGN